MVYVFGSCELDVKRYVLRCAGTPVQIEPKAFDVLAHLIRHRDRVVTKGELKAALWPGVSITDDALVRAIMGGRKAVQDDGVRQQIIQTFHGRGYQFVAPLEVHHDTTETADALPGLSAPRAEAAPPLRRMRDDVFVGRQQEIYALRASLADALAGRGQLVLLAGEPGIGKTRTTDELATYAQQLHVQTLVGRCYQEDGAPAFWPWIQMVRAYVSARDAEALQTCLGVDAAVIAAIVPAVREQLPHLPAPPALHSRQARFRFFDALTTLFKATAAERPLLLILDNLHWADKPSLRLLQFLASELQTARILLVATYRNIALGLQHPLTQTLGELARVASSRCYRLHGLSVPEVEQLIEQSTGQQPSRALLSTIYRQTEGNPFFVKEIVRLLHSEGGLERAMQEPAEGLTIPPQVRAVIGSRLAALSKTCVRVLTVAAVVGREFDLSLLERLCRFSNDRLLTVLAEGTAAHIIEEVPETIGRYRFSHALIRDTLVDELTAARRVWLHRRIGVVLEGLCGANPEPYLPRLAYHFCQAAAQGEVEKAVDYAILAGQQASTMLAYEEAADHYARALQALERQEPVDAWRCGEVLLVLGGVQMRAGDTVQAHATLQRAAELGQQLASPGLLAHAALGFGASMPGGGENGDGATVHLALLETALSALPETDSVLRVKVMSRLAVALYYANLPGRATVLSQQAVDSATRLGDITAQLEALHSRHWTLYGPDHLEEQLAVATTMVQVAEAAGNSEMALLGHRWRLIDLLTLGDMPAVDAEIATYARWAAVLRLPHYQLSTALFRAMRAVLEGRCADAERLAQEALTIGQRVQPQLALQAFEVQMFCLRWQQGRLQELEEEVKGFVAQYPGLLGWRCALTLLYGELGRHTEAQRLLIELAARDCAALPRNGYWLAGMAHLAQVCAYLGDAQRAAMLYELLRPYAGHNVAIGSVACYGSVAHWLGLLAATRRCWEHALQHFEAALTTHTRMGAPPLVARTQLAYAAMLLTRDQPDDREKALGLLAPALETAQALGMQGLLQQARTLQRQY